MTNRITFRVEIDPSAKDALQSLCQRHGMKQRTAMTRLVENVARLDRSTLALLLGQIPPEHVADVTRKLLKQLAAPAGATAP